MNARTLLFVVIVLGYFAFEIFVASRNAYRMEPAFIFNEFVAASHAANLCGPLKPAESARFDANYNYARRRAEEAASQTTVTAQEVEGRRKVDELVSQLGCDDIELFKLRKRYENLARQNLPTRESDWQNDS